MRYKDSLRGAIIGAGALVATVILASTAYDGWRLHQQLMAANEQEVGNLALALATGTARNVQAVDVLLRDTATWYGSSGRQESAPVVQQALGMLAVGFSQVSVLTIVDRSGMQRYRSQATGEPLSDVSDRSYFVRQRDDDKAGLVINEPVVTRSEKLPALILSRPLRSPDGTFDGVVSAVLTLQDLQSTFAALRLNDNSSVMLALADGTIVTRQPSRARLPRDARLPRLPKFEDEPLIDHVVDPIDGRAQLLAAQRVDGRSLVIAVTRDEREALRPWYDEMAGAALRTAVSMGLVLVAIVGVLRQLSRIEQGEQALLDSQERYAMAMEAANEGHTEWNLPAGTVFASSQWRTLHGLHRSQAIQTIQDLKRAVRIHDDDSKGVWTAIDEHLLGQAPGIDIEYRVQHQDRTWKWIQTRGRCVRDASSAPLRLYCAAHDISARKEAELSKIALETRVEQARRMEALGTLAGGIAHDFNNLLGAILGFGEMARRQAEEGSPMQRHIDRVLQAGCRAKALVHRVLQFSRSGPTERTLVSIQGLVEEAIVILAPSVRDGIALKTALEADGISVAGEATQLYQVVANLCMNAFQAIDGTGEVRLRLAAVRIDERRAFLHGELAAGSYVRLDVDDTGHGMSPEIMARMFDPFFTTKPPGEGTGLGLSVVHGVVTELGGAIDVRSELDGGTCISVWLPIPVAGDVDPVEGPGPDRGSGQVVMIVDDEPLLVELTEEVVVELGYVALTFGSGERACASFDDVSMKVDLLLTDEKMPGMSGSQLVAAVRAKGWDGPSIMMSGNVTAALEQRASAIGVSAVLRKPLSRETLAAALARLLRPQR